MSVYHKYIIHARHEFPDFEMSDGSKRQIKKSISPYVKRAPHTSGKQQGRNEKCECGSGMKYKKCCQNKDNATD